MVELAGVQLLGREMKSVAEELSRTAYRFEPRDFGLWCAEAASRRGGMNGIN
jgi:hypothetical protein